MHELVATRHLHAPKDRRDLIGDGALRRAAAPSDFFVAAPLDQLSDHGQLGRREESDQAGVGARNRDRAQRDATRTAATERSAFGPGRRIIVLC